MKTKLFCISILTTFLSYGQTTFTEVKTSVGTNYNSTAVSDINGDGHIDVVCSRSLDGYVDIFFNNGNASFTKQSIAVASDLSKYSNLRSIEVIDWDLDGDLDILVAGNVHASQDAFQTNGGVFLITNEGNNTTGINSTVNHILSRSNATSFTVRIFDIAVGDLVDNDDYPDIYVSSDHSGGDVVKAYKGNGTTSLVSGISDIGDPVYTIDNPPVFVFTDELDIPIYLTKADTDSNGKLEIYYSDYQNNRYRRFEDDGTTKTFYNTSTTEPRAMVFKDLNANNRVDYISINGALGNTQLKYAFSDNNGDAGTYTTISNFHSDSRGIGVNATDFDNDGDIDIVATDYATTNSNPVKYFENDGSLNFTEKVVPFTGDNTGLRMVYTTDFDNNGYEDFLVEEVVSGHFIIYLVNNAPSLLAQSFNQVSFTVYPNPVQNTLTIQLEEKLEQVEVFSVLGKKVLTSTTKKINTSALQAGIYLLKITTTEGKIATQKIIKN